MRETDYKGYWDRCRTLIKGLGQIPSNVCKHEGQVGLGGQTPGSAHTGSCPAFLKVVPTMMDAEEKYGYNKCASVWMAGSNRSFSMFDGNEEGTRYSGKTSTGYMITDLLFRSKLNMKWQRSVTSWAGIFGRLLKAHYGHSDEPW
jgi:hypothetical protein